jgi:NADP-reducing hydrogenase subunit HndB
MKSLAELAALRQKSLDKLNMRNEDSERGRIVVGMATCGIAAGARPVMNAFVEELNTRNLADVTVGMTGCMGMCVLEPMVDVYDKEGNKTTYVQMTPEKAKRVVAEHIVNGQPVAEYTIAGQEANKA